MKLYRVAKLADHYSDDAAMMPMSGIILGFSTASQIKLIGDEEFFLVKDEDLPYFHTEHPTAKLVVVKKYGNLATDQEWSRFANIKVE